MSDTPRTDALLKHLEENRYNVFEAQPHIQELARQIERELAEALHWKDVYFKANAEARAMLADEASSHGPNSDQILAARRWAALMFLDPMDIVTVAMGAISHAELHEKLAERCDRRLAIMQSRATHDSHSQGGKS